jgi:hydrogenase maturation factor
LITTAMRPAGAPDTNLSCGPGEHCITCGDQASQMRVVSVDETAQLATCRELGDVLAMTGVAEETVDIGLLADLAAGDIVLVHAGTALVQLRPGEVEA